MSDSYDFSNARNRGTLRREVSLKALDLLAVRDHSRQELKLKLEKRFLPREIRKESDDEGPEGNPSLMPVYFIRECIDGALDALTARGYLNDRRFAEHWVISRLRKRPEGRGALETGLRSKGVSRQIAAGVLAEAFTPETEQDALSRAGEKLARKAGITREKLTARLVSRGFSYGQVKTWVETHAADLPEKQGGRK